MSSNVLFREFRADFFFFYTNIVWFVYEQLENLAFSPDQTQQLIGLAVSDIQCSAECSQVYWRAAPARGKNLFYLFNRVSRTRAVYNIRGQKSWRILCRFLDALLLNPNQKASQNCTIRKKNVIGAYVITTVIIYICRVAFI